VAQGSRRPASPDAWARHRARLETIHTDLLRLRDIVERAANSLVAGPSPLASPADRREADEVLSVNPEVSDRVLKKLVEALRACWHPDLARDEVDRRQREDRLKHINVAWDLITGKRQEV
jgi:hypothetical protein